MKRFWSGLRTVRIFYVEKNVLAILLYLACAVRKGDSKKDVDEQLSVHFFAAGERECTRMEVSPGLNVTECCKEFLRFIRTRVETSWPQDGVKVAAHPNAFGPLVEGQAAHSHTLQKGQLPKRKDAERQPRSDWRLFNCDAAWLTWWRRRNWGSSEAQLRLRERSSWKVCYQSSSTYWSLHELREWRWGFNVHKPQLFLDFWTAHPDQFNRPELHGCTKLPPLNQN